MTKEPRLRFTDEERADPALEMMGLSVTAFAQGTDQTPAEDATNDANVVVEETEDSPALTPEGNAALVDDFGGNKQLITVTTKAGNYGIDPRGNLTRIDNALAQMSQRLDATKAQLDNLYQQQAAAKEEVGKPFPYEEDLRVKSARLVELDTLLNLDGRGRSQPESVIAKSARPSVLDSLKRPVPPRNAEKKSKQHEEVR